MYGLANNLAISQYSRKFPCHKCALLYKSAVGAMQLQSQNIEQWTGCCIYAIGVV